MTVYITRFCTQKADGKENQIKLLKPVVKNSQNYQILCFYNAESLLQTLKQRWHSETALCLSGN